MKTAVAVIIKNNNGQILLMQRGPKARSEHGKWENCGGGLEEGEEVEAGLRREVREELGVELINLKPSYSDLDPGGDWETFVFSGKIVGEPTNNEPDYCTAIKWVDPKDLATIDLATYSRRDFERLGWL